MSKWKAHSLLAILLVAMVGVEPASARSDDAPGGPGGKGPCVRACTNGNRGCKRQAQVNKLECRYGCSDLQEVYLVSCGLKEGDPDKLDSIFGGTDPDDPESVCGSAKAAFEACWNPCRIAFSRQARSCVGKLRACYFRQCGILPPPP